ncbi:helix-turn-helix domain-containing protein [Mangrovibacter phragmitis]|uniref:helix-turn-helix domain-containing protein n=1 Tax=Mangrovibacter phragmitis TaxID=1691903 RepID=UPI00336A2679
MNSRTEFIADLITWINNNIESPLKLDDVAIKSGYSKWHLQRLFFTETGQCLGAFIRERKLYLIAEELIKSDDSLINLAIRFGFDSQQSLNRAFRQRYNLPPHQYRKKYCYQHSAPPKER